MMFFIEMSVDKFVSVRVADLRQGDDAVAFIEVLKSYALDPMGGGTVLSSEFLNTVIQKQLEFGNNLAVLAFVDGKPAGMANCFFGFSTFKAMPLLNIHDFAVMKEFRRLGIGRLMLEKLEQEAKERGCCKLTLEVLENNLPAKELYSSFGFEGYELNPEMGKAVFWQKAF